MVGLALVVALCAALPASAQHEDDSHGTPAAAGETDAHGAARNPLTESGTISNALATVITFGLVVLLLGKFVWPVVLKSLKAREDFIRESLQSAKADREQAQSTLAEYKTQMGQARQEATTIVEEGRRDAEVVHREIQDEARAEADAMIKRARREIQIARDTAVKDLYTTAGNLATDLAGRIIHKEIDPGTHEQLIQESIDQIAKSSN
jgi:F-type H+-transporting ATPase subunit b